MSVPVAARVKRVALRIAMPLLAAYQWIVRPLTRSVCCVLIHADEVLLVRHSYRDRDRWTLPGGFRRRGETAVEAARREMGEELGRSIGGWEQFRLSSERSWAGIHRTAYLRARLASRETDPDLGELAHTGWFRCEELPDAINPDAASVVRSARFSA